MNFLIVTYLIVYAFTVGGVTLGGFLLHLKKSRVRKGCSVILPEEITVLIPFRNEETRLGELLDSILNSAILPYKFIFIDDHSDDNSSKLIEEKMANFPYEIMNLPDGVIGKKKALRAAINTCETKYILTFDADVSFNSNYFNSLGELCEADMYVLPASLVGRTLSELFYELDVVLANGLNTSLSGISRPIFSSGANFLFKREVFTEVDDLKSHEHMASGDDTYLLRDFRKHNKDVRLESSLNVAIETGTPKSFREFIDQRLRWIGKTADIGDLLATASAAGQFILTLVFFGLLIYCLTIGDLFQSVLLFSIKVGLDLIFFLPFCLRINRIKTWSLIPIYEIVFPIYSLIIGVLMLTYKPKWKGREIQH